MKMLSTKPALKTAAFAFTVFLVNQGAALAETTSAPSQTVSTGSVTQLHSAGQSDSKFIRATERHLASGQRVSTACDDDGSPCPHDDVTGDAF